MKRSRLKPRSKKMAATYVERRALVGKVLRPGARCVFPDCWHPATQVHEIWTRARSGSDPHALLCPDNVVGLCSTHHDLITVDTALGERLGLVRASWDGCPCGHGRTST